MRLIDADALLKELGITDEECTKCEWGDGNGFCTRSADFTDACDAICTAPTVEERKKGKWIPVDSYSAFGGDESTWMAHGNPIAFYYCSECKEQTYADENGESIISNFCPDCGADMRGEQDGNDDSHIP